MISYLTAVVSFIVALVGILGHTKRENVTGLKAVTGIGWLLVVLAIVTFGVSVYSDRKAAWDRDRQVYWALREVEFSTYSLLEPYLLITDPPEATDRFKLAKSLLESKVFEGFCDINPYEPAYSTGFSWATLLSERTGAATSRLGETMARYQAVLSADVLELAARLRNDPWVDQVIFLKTREFRWNQRGIPNPKTTLCGPGEARRRNLKRIESFGAIIAEMETLLDRELSPLRKRLEVQDEARFPTILF